MCSECAWISKHDTSERIASAEPCVLTSDQSPEASLRSLNPWSLPWPGDLHSAPWFSRWRKGGGGWGRWGREAFFRGCQYSSEPLCVTLLGGDTLWRVSEFGQPLPLRLMSAWQWQQIWSIQSHGSHHQTEVTWFSMYSAHIYTVYSVPRRSRWAFYHTFQWDAIHVLTSGGVVWHRVGLCYGLGFSL